MSLGDPPPPRYDGRMPYRTCGNTGLKLSALSLGFWHNFGGSSPTSEQTEMVHTAFDGGITSFDLANNYGPPYGSAEINVGKILSQMPRDEFLVLGSRKHILASLDQSLKRTGLDYFDIFYSHCFDASVPLEETALDTAVHQGKALYVGLFNGANQRCFRNL